jgi:hypothetical protein
MWNGSPGKKATSGGLLEPDVELKDPETRKGDKRKKSLTSVGVAFNMYY